MSYRLSAGMIAICIAIGFSGCQSMKMGENGTWNPMSSFTKSSAGSGDEFKTPVRMAVIWKETVMEKPGEGSARGFVGRVFFYDDRSQPIKAEGELTVYGYDNAEDKSNVSADRLYVFKQDEFQDHFAMSGVGPSYTVWTPWDKPGGLRRSVALVPVFKTAKGKVLKGGHTIGVLPGKDPDEDLAKTKKPYKVFGFNDKVKTASGSDGSSVKQASGIESGDNVDNVEYNVVRETRRIESVSIPVPPSLDRQMKSLPAQDLTKMLKDRQEQRVAAHANPNKTRIPAARVVSQEPADKSERAWHNNPTKESRGNFSKSTGVTKPTDEAMFGKPGRFK